MQLYPQYPFNPLLRKLTFPYHYTLSNQSFKMFFNDNSYTHTHTHYISLCGFYTPYLLGKWMHERGLTKQRGRHCTAACQIYQLVEEKRIFRWCGFWRQKSANNQNTAYAFGSTVAVKMLLQCFSMVLLFWCQPNWSFFYLFTGSRNGEHFSHKMIFMPVAM